MIDIRPDVRAYFEMMAAAGGPSLLDLEPAAARSMVRQSGSLAELPARDMPRRDIRIPAGDGGSVPARLYTPRTIADAAPVIVFYHGGGWVLGGVEGYDPLCSEIACQLGLSLLSVDYRLAPEHRFPAAVEDSIAAARWVAAAPAEIGHAVSGLIVAGDSAGGALAAVVARELIDHAAAPVIAQWLMYPVTDLSKSYPSDIELGPMMGVTEEGAERFFRFYLGDAVEENKRHPHVSPLLGERWQGLPPAVVFTCSLDPLRDQGRAYAARLVSEGIATVAYEAQGQIHACLTMRKLLPSAQDDLARGIDALRFLLQLG